MENRQKKIIIIGAGIAGIAAARELYKGHKHVHPFDIKILEASHRAGGRILTTDIDGVPVDLGATVIHGSTNENVIYELAKQFGFVSGDGEWRPMWNESTTSAILTNGEQLPSKIALECWEKFLSVADEDSLRASPLWAQQYNDLYSYLVAEYPKVMEKDDSTKEVLKSPYYNAIFECFLKFQATLEGVGKCKHSGIQGTYCDLPGVRDLRFDEGHAYGCLLKKLLEDIPKDTMLYGREVVSINTESNPTMVKCRNGDQFEADHVIVTVSLGVLKRRCLDENLLPDESSLFVPPLPVDKLKAIRDLGFGELGKIILRFEEEITSKYKVAPLMFLWRPEDKEDLVIKQKFPWATEFIILERIHNSNLYETWVDATSLSSIESASEEEIAEAISYVLGKMFKHPVPKPIGVYKHGWSLDPLFYGAYVVHLADIDTSACIAVLQQPLYNNRLLFAGEATINKFYSTVHGAYWTGIREATRLIKLI